MKTRSIAIAAARREDGPAIAALLRQAGLPCDDIGPHLGRFFAARDEAGTLVGAIGAEVFAPVALLRSLVVAPARQGAGLGDQLWRRIEMEAAAWGVERWWLLTTTAGRFFSTRGFVLADRAAAPAAIRGTRQFGGGCGDAALCFTRERRSGA